MSFLNYVGVSERKSLIDYSKNNGINNNKNILFNYAINWIANFQGTHLLGHV